MSRFVNEISQGVRLLQQNQQAVPEQSQNDKSREMAVFKSVSESNKSEETLSPP